MIDKKGLSRLFWDSHTPLTPEDTIDGEPDKDETTMKEFAETLHEIGYEIIRKCPPNEERDICIRKLYEALIYADFSLMVENYK